MYSIGYCWPTLDRPRHARLAVESFFNFKTESEFGCDDHFSEPALQIMADNNLTFSDTAIKAFDLFLELLVGLHFEHAYMEVNEHTFTSTKCVPCP